MGETTLCIGHWFKVYITSSGTHSKAGIWYLTDGAETDSSRVRFTNLYDQLPLGDSDRAHSNTTNTMSIDGCFASFAEK